MFVDIKSEVDRLGAEIEAAEGELIQRKAQLAGLRAQRDALAGELAAIIDHQRSPDVPPTTEMPNLRTLDRTDAIVEVLRLTSRPMSIQEVWDGLKAGGRSEPGYQVVASTLAFLQRNGKINKTGRGRYAA